MANNLDVNPIVIDSFGSDCIVSLKNMVVTAIHFYSATATDHFSVRDKNDVEVIQLLANTNLTFSTPQQFNNAPYTAHTADGAYAASARAWIYLR